MQEDKGFTISYAQGDECFYDKNKKNFSSEIRFICDNNVYSSPITQIKNPDGDLCHVIFEWKTAYACK